MSLMTIKQAVEYSGINRRTLYNAIAQGWLKKVAIPEGLPVKTILVTQAEVDRFKANRPKPGPKNGLKNGKK